VSSPYTVRPATYADIEFVAQRLRELDREEFVAATGRSPARIMADMIPDTADVWCGLVNEVPAAIYGLDVTPEGAVPWMVGTPDLEGVVFGRWLLRFGRKLFAEWAAKHGTLSNHAYAKNVLHIKFIRLLGCEVGDPEPHGALRLPFRKFTYVPSNARSHPGDH
jgi:hypothetical protein